MNSKHNYKEKEILLVGPILSNGGIATVVKSILSEKIVYQNYHINIINTSNYKDSSKFGNLLIFMKAVFAFIVMNTFRRVDLIHVHSSVGVSFLRKIIIIFISSFYKKKIIFHFHSGRFDDFFINVFGIRKKIITYSLKKVDKIVLLCEDWKKKIDEKYSLNNTLVIGNPVPFNVKKAYRGMSLSNKKNVKILFVGFLIKNKGIYDLIKIVQGLNCLKSDFKLIVCGKGEDEKKFLKLINDMNSERENIIYRGWISGKEKMNLYKEGDILLLPSYYEGMPMVILEAMAFGLPIVSTNIAGIPDLVVEGENGYLLDPGDVDGFINKIYLFIKDPKKRFEFGIKSYEISKKFAKNKIAEQWHILYQELLKE